MRAGLQTGKFPLLVYLERKSLMLEEKDQLFVLMERSSRKRHQLRDVNALRRIGNVTLGLKDRGMGLVFPVMGRKSTTRLLRVVQQKAHMCIHQYLINYRVSQGYRKVAGDVCLRGVDHKALTLPCPYFGSGS